MVEYRATVYELQQSKASSVSNVILWNFFQNRELVHSFIFCQQMLFQPCFPGVYPSKAVFP